MLFCDLVDSTRLAAGLDPEDWREIVLDYYRAAGAVIQRFEGHVGQYLGDGLLVYFGYPQAHEDDAERAVRAGLGIVEALVDLNRRLEAQARPALSVRIGIHTGLVVVGEMSGERQETLALGDTTNVAARLQGEAGANAVVLSPATLRLVQGIFVTRDLGARALKGVAEPLPVYQAVRPSGMRSRLDVAAATGLTPLIGRDQELGLLDDRFAQVGDGLGQAVVICGEAGIGKSRLVQAFRERISARAHTWLECRASPYTQDSALYPVLELQRQGLGFAADDTPEAKLARLEVGLAGVGFDLARTLPLLASFHSLPLPDRYADPVLSAEGRRKQTLDLLCEWLLRLGRDQPVVLLMEDLHWMDPSTMELLSRILAHLPTAPLLLLAIHRPDFAPPWGPHSHVTPLLLSRLTSTQLADLVRMVARGRDVSGTWVEEVVRRSDGVPLFAEELTRVVLESKPDTASQRSEFRIPETLQDSLMARLDALGPVKKLAQLGAVLGREFEYALLSAVAPLREVELAAALATAVREELFYQRGVPPHATYLFKHALIRDAAYQSMVRSTRQRHHRRVAETIVERMPETAEAQPELVARHFEGAGLLEEAVLRYWQAGERAQQRSAHREAIEHLQKATDLFLRRADAQERPAEELRLRIALGNSLQAADGFAGDRVREAYERAARLSRALEKPSERVYAVRGLAVYQSSVGDMVGALETLRELRPILGEVGPAERATIANLEGYAEYQLGHLATARRILDESVAAYDPSLSQSLIAQAGIEVAVTTIGWSSMVNWVAGRPQLATARGRQAEERARAVEHPLTLAVMLVFAGIVENLCGRPEAGAARAQEALEISEQQNFPLFRGYAQCVLVWSLPADAELIAQAEQGLVDAGSTGAVNNTPFALAALAEVKARAGALEDALGVIQMARGVSDQFGLRFWDAELRRIEAEIRLGLAPDADAEPLFHEALDIARQQGARSLELRAATSLARLWQRRGRHGDGRALLAPVYGWFTEGLDTRDLQEAKALLEDLASHQVSRPGSA